MAKKTDYNIKKPEELKTELVKLRTELRANSIKTVYGKNNKDYRIARKNIARVLTALNSSTNQEK